MEVGIRELRAHLSRYVRRAQEGEEIVVTDRGLPVARLLPASGERAIDRLIRLGLVEPAPVKGGIEPPEPIRARGTVSDLVAEQRR